MTQPTAVQWMTANIQLIIDFADGKLTQEVLDEIYNQAKEMEKEQHLKTWTEGLYCETGDKQAFEQYYNETFKSE